MSKPEQIAGMIAEAEKTLGAVDILVSNAGIQHVANIEDFPAERWDAIIAINMSAVFLGMQGGDPGDEAAGLGADHQHRLGARAGRERRRRWPMSRPSTGSSA